MAGIALAFGSDQSFVMVAVQAQARVPGVLDEVGFINRTVGRVTGFACNAVRFLAGLPGVFV